MNKLSKWIDVYPQGTKEGDEEQKFFIAIARNKKWKWRTVSAIEAESKLSRARIEEIIEKYTKSGMIVANPNVDDSWGYWERLDAKDEDKSIDDLDKDNRIKDA